MPSSCRQGAPKRSLWFSKNLVLSLQCTVSCGQGLRYRVVLCIDHRGLHAGGCSPATKPHIKEECVVTVPCYKPPGGSCILPRLSPNVSLDSDQSPGASL